MNKLLAWALWAVLAGASAVVGFVFLMFALSGPDHAVAGAVVQRFTFIVVGGMGVPLAISLYFMVKSKFVRGAMFALLMIPSMIGFLLLFEK